MGIFPCPLPCQPHEDSDHFNQGIQSDSSSNSLSSQSSLPSVPSLNSSNSQQSDQSTTAGIYHHCAATLKGHSSYVFSLALAGKHFYSGSSDSEIRSWGRHPSTSNNASEVLAATKSAVKSLVVFGNKLISAHQDHKIRVWNIDSDGDATRLKCTATLPKLNDRVTRFFSAKNYVEVRRHKKCTWVHHVDAISALALSPDGSTLYSASWDRTFKVWRTSDFSCTESVWNAHDDAINAIVVSAHGFVYTCSADHKIKVWKKEVGQKKHTLVDTLEKHKSAVNALALSADGNVLYSGAYDRSIIVWERNSGGGDGGHMAVAGALRGHKKAILCLGVVGDLVCSGSADKTVRIWRRESNIGGKNYLCLAVMEGHRGPVKCLTAAVDSSGEEEAANSSSRTSGRSYLIYSGSLDCDIKIWKLWVPFT